MKLKDLDKTQCVKQLGFELEPNYDSSTSQSQNSIVTCPHVKHNLLTDSGCSLPLRFHQMKLNPTNLNTTVCTLPVSGSEPMSVGSISNNQPMMTSLSNPSQLENTPFNCGTFGLSPDSPTYCEKHTKFCHTGAHALDVFTSPDDVPTSSSSGAFWRPKTESPNQGSPAHNMGLLGCMYCFPTVGADSPRIPMQQPIVCGEAQDDPDIIKQDVIKRELKTTMLLDCSQRQNGMYESTVDKQPPHSKGHLLSSSVTCSKDTDIDVCINTVEALYTPVPDTSLR